MTTEATPITRRVFKYGGQTFPDPGEEYTAQQVLNHLKTFFPELGHATIEEKNLADGTLEITFNKQVTRKAGR
ncbi:MAG: PRTRC system protein C [Chloroflexi bacterium]|nr:PRTRC system protein C [Chloroflexota bacterium]MCI0728601.1 PRTRC system protein C [Chloroflexota bacterium]